MKNIEARIPGSGDTKYHIAHNDIFSMKYVIYRNVFLAIFLIAEVRQIKCETLYHKDSIKFNLVTLKLVCTF